MNDLTLIEDRKVFGESKPQQDMFHRWPNLKKLIRNHSFFIDYYLVDHVLVLWAVLGTDVVGGLNAAKS